MAREVAGRPPEETLSLWKREQALLKGRVVDRDTEAWQRDPAFSGLRRVGGVDVSFVKGDSVSACASLVVLSYPELEVLYEDCRMVSLTAPYVSGFLAFREVPFLVDAVRRLREKEPHLMPQVLLVDGNGVLHHRGFGVACHLGILTDLPCIGVAKKLLQVDGLENNALHKEKIRLLQAGGDTFPLMGGSGAILGMALKSHDHSTKPLYVSVGHKMSLEAAVRLTRGCCRFRIPEPVRQVGGPPGVWPACTTCSSVLPSGWPEWILLVPSGCGVRRPHWRESCSRLCPCGREVMPPGEAPRSPFPANPGWVEAKDTVFAWSSGPG
ncbi:PREDICTED: endonuclease V isoform X3 [Hipposideros armiger]|uniref:Endonuclease V n=1 Tax=Hipposideros armiger TaxID=186990 RepID=A0A8B7RFL7_HIPAR|nr:PREDICTED: endonuclease V isoform X3 [Hipposideros armiger]